MILGVHRIYSRHLPGVKGRPLPHPPVTPASEAPRRRCHPAQRSGMMKR